ncbi:L-ribulose-5-phosphate 3-epimerase UlaE [Rosistilla carotiformis]|uniref:L-ribulose-5-phosphate 3-epimerase UlaE n=1 Tax=Rosistilla carotiformis TaxID=2528017 RepID=A0A518K0Q0_9BACT|nr:sugar phosphate isomerase/epimerase [Rosistilla carotiformis]QDV71376.1 L-ribulose-5-phosphate 3-epimerase UlaE [Rosistilla carotiformis]
MHSDPLPRRHRADRRTFLLASTALTTAACRPESAAAHSIVDCSGKLSLGFSLYGMRDIKTEVAIQTLREIGYDSVEFCLLEGFDTDPARLDRVRRRDLRATLAKYNMCLRALMEHLPLSTDQAINQQAIERLKRAAALGHDLEAGDSPLIETVLGGGNWLEVRDRFAETLRKWAALAEREDVQIAIKPHVHHAVDTPEKARWLMRQVGNERIGLAYDYSHFAAQGIDMNQSVRDLAAYTLFVHAKDAIADGGQTRFALPGSSGKIDYPQLLKRLIENGYAGDFCVEVSSQIWKQPGYDAIAAAKESFRPMADAFHVAGIERPK